MIWYSVLWLIWSVTLGEATPPAAPVSNSLSLETLSAVVAIVATIFGVLTTILAVGVGWYTKVTVGDAKADILKAVKEGYVSQEQLQTFSAKIGGQMETVVGDAKDAILKAVKEGYVSQEQLQTFSAKITGQIEQVETELTGSVNLLTQRFTQTETELKSCKSAIERVEILFSEEKLKLLIRQVMLEQGR